MPGTYPLDPVLHTTAKDFLGNETLGFKILNQGIFANPLVFVNPTVTKVEFETEVLKLRDLRIEADGNTKKRKERDAQSVVVHEKEAKLLLYVKPICNHNITMINLTGFDSNYMPTQAGLPETNGSVKVTKGKQANTYKVYLTRRTNKPDVNQDPQTHQRGVKYTIELTTTPEDEASWKIVCTSVASTKLIFSAVVKGKRNWVRVFGVNAAGKGQPNAPFPFTPDE